MIIYSIIYLIVTFCTAAPIEERDHIPPFINGRPKGGFMGKPYIKPSNDFHAAEPQWFTQTLNHFDDSDSRTWKQKYYVNGSTFGMDGPVFLMIGGEGPLSANWVAVGTMMEYAEKYKALVIALEHRFYGESHPLSDMSTPNLKYLSSEQALADLAAFREAMVKQFSLTPKNRWIAFGGSYPGALSAWFRYKYPHLVYGAVASSAPIFAQLDFPQYLEVSTASLTDDLCRVNVAAASRSLDDYSKKEAGLKYLSTRFKTCKPLEVGSIDIQNFAQYVAGNFFGVIQYNKDNREFEGVVGTNITIATLCGIMNKKSLGDPIERYAIINDMIMETYGSKCLDAAYSDYISAMKKVDWKSSAAEGGRQWLYQTCTEFGYYQSTDSEQQVFGTLFPLSFFMKQCIDIFGESFNATVVKNGIGWTNANYGGYGLTSTRIIFPNGSIDPWHALSFTESVKDIVAIYIKVWKTSSDKIHIVLREHRKLKSTDCAYDGHPYDKKQEFSSTAHCANMYPSSPDDSPELVEARQKIGAMISKWLESPDKM